MGRARAVSVLSLVALATAFLPAIARAEAPRPAAETVAVAGPVSLRRPAAAPRALRFRDLLYWRDVVESQKDGVARVLLGGKATVTVRELTRLELREEQRPQGVHYVADVVSGKIRASVARMLMRGDTMEVWTFNTVASVRGTDFIVEVVERPSQAGSFGALAVRTVAEMPGDRAADSRETVVVTLSGLVAASSRLAGTGRAETIAGYEGVRLSGRLDPVRFPVSAEQMRGYLQGLTPPRPGEARSGDRAESVGASVERAALAQSGSPGGAGPAGAGDVRGPALSGSKAGGANGNGLAGAASGTVLERHGKRTGHLRHQR